MDAILNDRFFSFAHITTNDYLVLLVGGVILYLYIFKFLSLKSSASLERVNAHCFIRCKSEKCEQFLEQARDNNYLNSTRFGDTEYKSCAFCAWELSHILLHCFIGYKYNIFISLALGGFFELYEHYNHACGSYMDIVYNTIGATCGRVLYSL